MGEVVEGDDRQDAVVVAGGGDPPIVVERNGGELPLGRLDPAPFEGEPVGAKAEAGHQCDVLRIAVEGVARVAAHVHATRGRIVLEVPPVVVHIAALDLMSGGSGAPNESVGEGHGRHGRSP